MSIVYTQLDVKRVLFQAIQFSVSTQFSSIWPIDSTLSGTTTPGQIGPVSGSNEEILLISQRSSNTGTSSSERLESYPGHLWEGVP